MTKLAIIAGAGGLPAALVAACPARPLICALEGFAPAGLTPDQSFRVERLALFLRWLEDQGVTEVCFAGAVQRPRLDPSVFDPATATMVPRLLAAMGQGDDATLREVLATPAWQTVLAGVPGCAPQHSGRVLSLRQVLPWWDLPPRQPPRQPRSTSRQKASFSASR